MPQVVPREGQVVRVRSRQYLVEAVVPPPARGDQTLVRLACLGDHAQGQPLEALREKEVDAQVMGDDAWVGQRGFDPLLQFSAYLNTLRWSLVTSTDRELFQAPYRAGIQIHADLEPATDSIAAFDELDSEHARSRRRWRWRYRRPETRRDEVLARLLALNARRAAGVDTAAPQSSRPGSRAMGALR